MQIKTDKKYVRRVLADLVKINSVNPSLVKARLRPILPKNSKT